MADERSMYFLAETSFGNAKLMSVYDFNDLIKQETGLFSIDMILLTACSPSFDARFVLNCGARHVIRINRTTKKEVDKITLSFIENLYDNLANKKTVCEAF